MRNFSSQKLSNNEILLLSKGVKFIATPSSKGAVRTILKDFEEFERKMRCQYLFDDGKSYIQHPFYLNTGFTPYNSCETLENYLFATRLEISKLKTIQQRSNLNNEERMALKTLKQNMNIIIRKADKCSTLCVLQKDNYIKEGQRQLENGTFYENIQEPKTEKNCKTGIRHCRQLTHRKEN